MDGMGNAADPTAWLDWTKNFCGQFGLIRNNLFAVSATQVSWQVSKGFKKKTDRELTRN